MEVSDFFLCSGVGKGRRSPRRWTEVSVLIANTGAAMRGGGRGGRGKASGGVCGEAGGVLNIPLDRKLLHYITIFFRINYL